MRKIIAILALALSMVLPALAQIKPGEKKILSQMPTASEAKQMTKNGIILSFGHKGMMITSASGVVFLTWEELAAYRYMVEKMEAGHGVSM